MRKTGRVNVAIFRTSLCHRMKQQSPLKSLLFSRVYCTSDAVETVRKCLQHHSSVHSRTNFNPDQIWNLLHLPMFFKERNTAVAWVFQCRLSGHYKTQPRRLPPAQRQNKRNFDTHQDSGPDMRLPEVDLCPIKS